MKMSVYVKCSVSWPYKIHCESSIALVSFSKTFLELFLPSLVECVLNACFMSFSRRKQKPLKLWGWLCLDEFNGCFLQNSGPRYPRFVSGLNQVHPCKNIFAQTTFEGLIILIKIPTWERVLGIDLLRLWVTNKDESKPAMMPLPPPPHPPQFQIQSDWMIWDFSWKQQIPHTRKKGSACTFQNKKAINFKGAMFERHSNKASFIL